MLHVFNLANTYPVYNMNNHIKYEPIGHLAATFTTNAATRGENGDLFLSASAPPIMLTIPMASLILPQLFSLPFDPNEFKL